MPNEIGFSLCKMPNGKLTHGPIATGTPVSVSIPVQCPSGSSLHGLFHSHPGGVPYPSQQDVKSQKLSGAAVSCIDADGKIKCFKIKGTQVPKVRRGR